MRNWRVWLYTRTSLLAVLLAVCVTVPAFAQTATSDNYQVTETEFNSGGTLDSCSGQYCARASIGNMNAGSSGSAAGESSAVFDPAPGTDPRLEVIVDPGESNLGILKPETTATKTTVVRINNYLAGGYTLQLIGDPPKFGNHSLNTPSSPTSSQLGEEQFAINIVANTVPSVGASPLQVPSNTITFGEAADNYDTPNQFMYSSEDVIARSDATSGRTDFTITMIINVSAATPAGHYTGEYQAVVVPAF